MKKVKAKSKKFLSVLLAFLMVISAIPATMLVPVKAMAEEQNVVFNLIDKDNNPVKNTEIIIGSLKGESNDEGRVIFSLENGDYDYSITANNEYWQSDGSITVTDDSKSFDVIAEKKIKVSGSAVDVDNGNSIISSAQFKMDEANPEYADFVSADGKYSFNAHSGMQYSISASADTYADNAVSLTVSDIDSIVDIELLQAARKVVYKITDNGTVTLSENEITDKQGETSIAVGDTAIITANSFEGYHISKLSVTNTKADVKVYDKNIPIAHSEQNLLVSVDDASFEIKKNCEYLVEIEFSINQYDVIVTDSSMGLAKIDGGIESVTYGSDAVLTIIPNVFNGIEAIEYNGENIVNSCIKNNNADSYSVNLTAVKSDIVVSFNAAQEKNVSLSDIIADDSSLPFSFSDYYIDDDNNLFAAKNQEGKNEMTVNAKECYISIDKDITTAEKASITGGKIENIICRKGTGVIVYNLADVTIIADELAPEITVNYPQKSDKYISSEAIEVSISVEDINSNTDIPSGINKVVYSSTNDLNKASEAQYNSTKNVYTFDVAKAFNGAYYVWAYDNVGNVSSAVPVNVVVDMTDPTIEKFEFNKTANGMVNHIINLLTFGIFSNNDVELIITTDDATPSSGINSIIVSYEVVENDEIVNKTVTITDDLKVTDNGVTASFTVTKEEFGKMTALWAEAVDNSGRKSQIAYPKVNDSGTVSVSNDRADKTDIQIIADSTAIIEEIRFESNSDENSVYNKEKVEGDLSANYIYFANDSINLVTSISEKAEDPGISSIKIEVTNNDETQDITDKLEDVISINNSLKVAGEKVHEQELRFELNGLNGNGIGSGENVITVSVTNNCGVTTQRSQSFYIDNTDPLIPENYTLSLNNPVTPAEKIIHFLSFGVFFNRNIDVTATAVDDKNADGTEGSGIKELILMNGSNDNIAVMKHDGEKFVAQNVDLNDFDDTEVFAYAIDNVGNKSEKSSIEGAQGFIDADGNPTSVESSKLLGETDAPKISCDVLAGNTDADGNEVEGTILNFEEENKYIFDYNPTVNVTISDELSGIYSIAVTQDKGIEGKETSLNYEIIADGLLGDNGGDLIVNDASVSFNLSLYDNLELKENDVYSITIDVMDNCGNTASETIALVRDTIKPFVMEFQLEKTNVAEQILNILTFGIFSNNTVNVIVTAVDPALSAGVKNLDLFYVTTDEFDKSVNNAIAPTENSESQTRKEDGSVEYICEFVLTEEQFSSLTTMYAVVTDNAGNASEKAYPLVDEDGKIKVTTEENQTVQVLIKNSEKINFTNFIAVSSDNEKPHYDKKVIGKEETLRYFADDNIIVSTTLKDDDFNNSGFRNITIEAVYGEKATEITDQYEDILTINENIKNGSVHEQTLSFALTGLQEKGIIGSGLNTIIITVETNAGNIISESISLYIDDQTSVSPYDYEVSKTKYSPAEKIIRFLSFGTFFNDDITIRFKVHDNKNADGTDGSDINKVTLYKYVSAITEEINENSIIGEYKLPDSPEKRNDLFTLIKAENGNSYWQFEKDFKLDTFDYSRIAVFATDNVGNQSNSSEVNSEDKILSNRFLGDTTPAEITNFVEVIANDKSSNTNKIVNSGSEESDAEYIVSNNSVLTFNITDKNNDADEVAGIYNIEVYQNGKTNITKIADENAESAVIIDFANLGSNKESKKKLNSTQVTVDTSKITATDNGLFDITIKVTDNAGNVSEQNVKMYKDTAYPVITGFKFEPKSTYDDIAVNEKNLYDVVESTDYGFYFKGNITVTATADDFAQNKECQSSIKTMYIKAVDINGTVTESYLDVDKSDDKFAPNTRLDEQTISLTVKKDFKGQIYAYAVDELGNTSVLTVNGKAMGIAPVEFDTKNLVDGWMHPNAAVIESNDKHIEEEKDSGKKHIEITRSVKTNNKTAKGSPLYAQNVQITFTVRDYYSGIRNVKWNVTAPYDKTNNQSGDTTIPNNMAHNSKTFDGWTIVKQEGNLVYEMKRTITVSNDSNDIQLNAVMTDRAGNTSSAKDSFSIDKTAPQITVVYDDKNVRTGNYNEYYNHDRTATITIRERNLNYKDVVRSLANIDETYKYNVPEFSKWQVTNVKNGQDPNNTLYSFKVDYTADGEYKFSIRCKDLAQNQSVVMGDKCKGENTYTETFIVDKIDPYITVEYAPNQSANQSGYFNETQTATVTIVEHNFNLDNQKEFINGIIVTNNGGATAAGTPDVIFSKTDKVDTYVAEVTFSGTSHYDIKFDYSDMSGRSISTYTSALDIDKEIPVLEISGIKSENYNAYNNKGNITPVFKITDADGNIDLSSVVIKLTGADVERGHIVQNLISDGTTSVKDITNGVEYTLNYFNQNENGELNDDIYTMEISFKDKAGNSYQKTLVFSINRFGSNFRINKNILPNESGCNYVQSILNVPFMTEINADDIENGNVIIQLDYDHNGVTKTVTLELGKDYIFTNSNTEQYQWNSYSYQLINASLFDNEGRYVLHIRTKDFATNDNIKDSAEKGGSIEFYVDKTSPYFENFGDNFDTDKVDVLSSSIELENPNVIIDNFDGDNYKMSFCVTEENLPTLEVVDAKDISVVYGGSPVENVSIEELGDKYLVSFSLPKAESFSDKKELVIKTTDKANNEASTINVKELYITNNRFLQIVNNIISNTILLIVIIVVFVAIIALLIFLIFFRKKKNEDE